jgi:hypothetical protein
MAIVPSGTRKIMIAQTFGAEMPPTNFGAFVPTGSPKETGTSAEEVPKSLDEIKLPKPKGSDNKENKGFGDLMGQQQKSDTATDLTEYVFNKLENFGYPPRRLEQFEDEFVHEKIFPGGVREVTIVIPDRYYAMRKRLSDADFSEIIKDIQEKYSLNFVDAERKDKKISMNFTSQKSQSENEEQPENFGDDGLEDIYGPVQSKSNAPKQKQKVTAKTMNEMIKLGRDILYEAIIKTEKNK